MYIRKVKKKNGTTAKVYEYLHLVDSIRTEKGPRQKLILNLGSLNIDPSLYPLLAQRIEGILNGQQRSLFDVNEEIETLAEEAVDKIIRNRSKQDTNIRNTDYQNIDCNSFEQSDIKSIGGEHVCNEIWKELGIDTFLAEKHGVGPQQLLYFKTLIFSRLLYPTSERKTVFWAKEKSAIHELIKGPHTFTLPTLYRSLDHLHKYHCELEQYLSMKENTLFDLDNTIMLFDLTNTYFEGQCQGNDAAKRGRSKEKRSDCLLMTLGLVINKDGFIKSSHFFPGNQSEPATLSIILETLMQGCSIIKPTVVMDAGIATEANLELLRSKQFYYIVVSRKNHNLEIDETSMEAIRFDKEKAACVKAIKCKDGDENLVYCTSTGKKLKEKSIRNRQEELFLEKVEYYRNGLSLKKRTKNYCKIIEMIGRLREKYPKASKLYDIEVLSEKKSAKAKVANLNAVNIVITEKEKVAKENENNDGCYVLRTNRMNLDAKQIWEIYSSLTRIEDSFRSMKSHLGFRPVFHQRQDRCESHLLISVLAYRIMNLIQYRLRKQGIHHNWSTLRGIFSTQYRTTLSYNVKSPDGSTQQYNRRMTSRASVYLNKLYDALKISRKILPAKTFVGKATPESVVTIKK
jgi:transposase